MQNTYPQNIIKVLVLLAITYAGLVGSVLPVSAQNATTTEINQQNLPVLLSTTTTRLQKPYRELITVVCTGTTPRNNLNNAPTTITHPWHWLTETCNYTYVNGTTTEFILSTTTSATTYKTQFKNFNASASVTVQSGGTMSTITLLEIAG